jgi:hypothetical protein
MSFVNRKLFGLVVLLLMVAGFGPRMHAQTNYGSVRGLAKDIQGGLITDADVTLTNVGTKVARTAKTNGAGEFAFSSVDPGTYVVTVGLKGFMTYKNTITVDLGLTATVDVTLQVGATTETVEVTTTSAVLIDTSSANRGELFTEQQLTELPNLGRNPFVFEKLDTNVTPVGDPRYVRAEDQSGSSAVSVAGAPIGSNNYIVDGIPTSTSSGGVTFIPSPEAVSDAKVEANTYDAEVGRTGGGAFNTSMKSGANAYHGALYGMTRQTPWSANSWANIHTPLQLGGVQVSPSTPRGDVTTYLYAGAFGGPLPLSEKSKYLKDTFFWVSEEGYRQAQPLPGVGNLIVPTAQEAAGNFSGDNVCNLSGCASVTLYDPTSPFVGGKRTTVLTGLLNGLPTANVIPASYMNPIGKWIAGNAFPSATFSTTYNQVNSTRVDTFKTRSDMYSGKVDHVFTPWWTSNASYVHLATQEPSGDFYGDKGNFSSDAKLVRYNDAVSVSNVFTLNPTTILTVGYGFNRYYSVSYQYSTGFNAANGFGGAGFPQSFVSNLQSITFPQITSNDASLGSATGNGGYSIPSASHNFVVGIQKTVGKQNLKAGYVYRALHVASQPTGGGNGQFGFTGNFTSVDGKATSSSTIAAASGTSVAGLAYSGSGVADLLLGLPDTGALTINKGYFNELASYHALYAQDDFRVTGKLTVNLGVRYEYEIGERELNNQLAVGFDRNLTYVFPSAAGPIAHGGIAYAGTAGYPVHCCSESKNKFSPRIGVAYEIRNGTVIRGGFGVFYAPVAVTAYNPGYTQASSYAPGNITSALTTSQIGTGAYLSNPFSGGANGSLVLPSGNNLRYLTAVGSSISVKDFNMQSPFVEQYSIDLQHELPWATSLKLGYTGAHAEKFPLSVNINQLSDTQFAALALNPVDMSAKVTNPYYTPTVTAPVGGAVYPTAGVVASSTVAQGQLLLPYPQFSTVTLTESAGYSLYNAFSLKVQKRATKGLTVLFGYTWASNWDNLYSGGSTLNSTNGPADNYNLKAEYARAVNDIPSRYTAGITYQLPVGRGHHFLSSAPRIVDMLIGGYDMNAIIIRQDGGPLAVSQGTNFSTTYGAATGFGGQVRPNLVAGANPCYSGRPESRDGLGGKPIYFNSAAFSGTPAFSYGTQPRSLPCKGPGLSNTDLSVNKTFSITEKVKFQFRAEALNVTNTPQFTLASFALAASQTSKTPGGAVTLSPSTTTGQLNQINYNRLIQMGGRITF